MNKKEFVHRISTELREKNVRKHLKPRRYTFTIIDEDGTSKDFKIKKREKDLLFTEDDIMNIVDASIEVILDSLKNGDNITIHGFATLGLKYRKPRMVRHLETGEPITIEGHYVPKLTAGKNMSLCARLYDMANSRRDTVNTSTDDGGDEDVV